MADLSWGTVLPPLLALGGTIVTLAAMAGQLRRARLIEDTPTSRIRSAAQGYVELCGLVRANDETPLLAPLTGTPCLWFRYTIERAERSRHGRHWRSIESGSSERAFVLDDQTGRCLIDPRRAEVTVQRRQRWSGNRRHPLRAVDGFVRRLLTSGSYRYTEWRIEADDWLYVLGWFATPRQPSFTAQRLARQKRLLSSWKQDQPALLARFDSNGDGQIDLLEWEQVRVAAERQAERETLAAPLTEPLPIVSRGHDERPFLLATEDPHLLARRYRWRALTALLGGACVTGFLAARVFGLW